MRVVRGGDAGGVVVVSRILVALVKFVVERRRIWVGAARAHAAAATT